MGDIFLLIAFFAVVMGGVAAAGYYFLHGSGVAGNTEVTLTTDEPVSAKQFLTDSLRSLGEAIASKPAAEDPMRRKLQAAGYRSPSAPDTYHGIVYSSAAIL